MEPKDPAGDALAGAGSVAPEAVRGLFAQAAHADDHYGRERKADRR